MQRRKFITAIGTLAIGTGTALGTGAFDATSSNSNAGLSVVTQTESAEINIVPGYEEFTNSDIGDDVYIPSSDSNRPEYIAEDGTIIYNRLSREDLPLAIVNSGGTGMANVQVAVEVGRPSSEVDFQKLLAVNNNDTQDYELGFTYHEGYGSAVTEEGVDASVANKAFQFIHDTTRVSPANDETSGETPANMFSVGTGDPVAVSLKVNTDLPALINAYGDVYGKPYSGTGDFVTEGDDAVAKELVSAVTAVADETSSRNES